MNIKSILPFDRYTLITELSQSEVMQRLRENVEARRNISMMGYNVADHSGKPYAGRVEGNHFEISRVITYKNSFLPVIKGDVNASFPGKTEVMIRMSPGVFVLGFSAVWMLMVLVGCVVVSGIMFYDGFNPMLLIPFGMLVFGSLLFTVPYKIEAKKSRVFLSDLLEEDEEPIVI